MTLIIIILLSQIKFNNISLKLIIVVNYCQVVKNSVSKHEAQRNSPNLKCNCQQLGFIIGVSSILSFLFMAILKIMMVSSAIRGLDFERINFLT